MHIILFTIIHIVNYSNIERATYLKKEKKKKSLKRDRTTDPTLTKRMLCQLSYGGGYI